MKKRILKSFVGLCLVFTSFGLTTPSNASNQATVFNPNTGERKVMEIGTPFEKGFVLETSFGYVEPNEDEIGYSVATGYRTTLNSSMTSVQTTLPTSSITLKDDHVLTMADLGSKVFFTIEPGSTKQETIMCTGISGTTWTGCTRGLAFYGTSTASVAGNRETHSSGSDVIMSNVHNVFEEFIDKDSDETLAGIKTFSVYPEIDDASDTVTKDTQFVTKKFVEDRNGYWEGTAADFASLPTGQADGEARVTLDDSKLYVWATTTQTWILAGSGGGAGTIYITKLLGSESDSGDLRTFTLTSGSFQADKWFSVFRNGILMSAGASDDYTTSGSNQAIFNYDVLATDYITLRVDSIDYYNPEWDDVDGIIAPDTDDTYDIGSSTKQFKDLYLSGDATVGDTLTVTGTTTLATTNISGIFTASDDVLGISKSTISLLAGETLTAGDAVVVKYETSALQATYDVAGDDDRNVATPSWYAQTFLTSTTATGIKKVAFRTGSGGTGSGTYTVSIRATSAGEPTGADLVSQTGVNGASDTFQEFIFDEPIAVSASTTYALVVRDSNAGNWRVTSAMGYADGVGYTSANSGSTWSEDTVREALFKIYEVTTNDSVVYKADSSSNNEFANNFIGFADANITSGTSGYITISGIDDNQSSLLIGSSYYLSDTSGDISASAGSQSRLVGRAISTTEIKIINDF